MDTISNTASSYDCTDVVVKAADGAAFIVDKQQTRLVFYNMALDLPTSNDGKNGSQMYLSLHLPQYLMMVLSI
jgi:hypothetical protein